MAKKKLGLSGGLGKFREEIKELVILSDLQSFIPPLTEEEKGLLLESIKSEGIREPIDIWHDGEKNIIVDGHNRYNIAQELGVSFKTKEHKFESIEGVKEWMLKKQLGRRNLTDANRSYLIGLLYNNRKESKGGDRRSQRNNDQSSVSKAKNTAELIAEQTGMSIRSIKSAGEYAKGIDELDGELKSKILIGKEKIPKSDIQKLSRRKPKQKINNKADLDKHLMDSMNSTINGNSKISSNKISVKKKIVQIIEEVGEDVFLEIINEVIPQRENYRS
ncbi:ParB N-terminal domain-containing protein [Plebeiibacterium sediminum]|uniref:ParB/Sulfiredoxin domain-containing protein n=1 Tax=Plebeiibacterium sediminum TaxID=2992112 RepID=A0AAE3M8X8_9BACT|nr:ParB N-terminal domain-containing protein [Plebeiobacterium sediminum]MCW3789401.1 hypothetical protein [Plebeiobacterium sediminum]